MKIDTYDTLEMLSISTSLEFGKWKAVEKHFEENFNKHLQIALQVGSLPYFEFHAQLRMRALGDSKKFWKQAKKIEDDWENKIIKQNREIWLKKEQVEIYSLLDDITLQILRRLFERIESLSDGLVEYAVSHDSTKGESRFIERPTMDHISGKSFVEYFWSLSALNIVAMKLQYISCFVETEQEAILVLVSLLGRVIDPRIKSLIKDGIDSLGGNVHHLGSN